MKAKTKSPKKKPGRTPKIIWNDSFYVRIYELALSGASVKEISAQLGVRRGVMKRWIDERPALREALQRARRPVCKTGVDETTPDHGGIGQRFIDYIYQRLPLHLQKLWDELEELTGSSKGKMKRISPSVAQRIENLFTHHGGKRARQHVWIYCLFATNRFNVVEACRKCNISLKTLASWEEEPEFKELLEEIHLHKKEMVERGIWRVIASGEPQTLRWASERLNPEKGWARPNKQLGGMGDNNTINQNVLVVTETKELDKLPLAERLKMLEQARSQRELPPIQLNGEHVNGTANGSD